jgi:transcription antitermination protein NusB
MGARRKGRELALQVLFEIELAGDDSTPRIRDALVRLGGPDESRTFAEELAIGVVADRERIDRLIERSSEHWRLGRLSNVDLGILRIATYEITARRDVPVNVAIDEAIEIAKRYSSAESATFVNGVLDQIATAVGAKEGRPTGA